MFVTLTFPSRRLSDGLLRRHRGQFGPRKNNQNNCFDLVRQEGEQKPTVIAAVSLSSAALFGDQDLNLVALSAQPQCGTNQ